MIHGKKRNGDLFKRLTESWGYTKPETVEEEVTPLDEEMAADAETVTEEEDVQEEGYMKRDDEREDEKKMEEGVFDASHYCIHHGGVHHEGKIKMAEAIQHVKPDENGHISHYDMRLVKSGIVLENVAAEDIQVTEASLAYNDVTESSHKRDADHKDMKDAPAAPAAEEEEEGKVEERARGRLRGDAPDDARDDERTRPKQEAVASDEDVVEEAADEEDDKLEETLRRLVADTLAKIRNS